MNNFVKKILPHCLAILLFVVLAAVYFNPVFDGKVLRQGDINNFKGMSKEIVDFRAQYNQDPLWTNSMFGGMPAYQISVFHTGNLMQYVDRFIKLGLPHPVGLVFLYLLGFYFLLMVLKVDPWLGVVGAIAFAFSSYFFIILEAGHNSKALAIAYMAPTFAGFVLLFRGKYLIGGAVTALFLALDLYANHPQITYYLFLFLMIYVLFETIDALKNKNTNHWLKAIGMLAIAAILAIGSDAGNLISTYQYGKYSTRGKSELTANKENKTSGLDKDYATQWSYGVGETMSLLIPDFKGGGSGSIGVDHKDALEHVDNQFKEYIAKSDQYWGDQPFTSGPVYAGCIVVFLFILGLFTLKGPLKNAILAGTILSILLAWGKNFMGFNELFLDYFPGYNKFRAVSMTLVIAEFLIPILAVLALDQLIKSRTTLQDKLKLPFVKSPVPTQTAFFIAFGLTGGLSLLFFLLPSTFTDFFKTNEVEQITSQITKGGNPASVAQTFIDNLQIARQSILKSDAMRTFGLILLAAALIFAYFKTKIERNYIVLTLAFFVLIDMWSVDKRYVNNQNFEPKSLANTPFPQTPANASILLDKDPDYRVLNIATGSGPFNDASTSYWHKSIGGYHGAKLKRYQELIDAQIDGNISSIEAALRAPQPSDSSIQAVFAAQSVLNMLNMRYLIYNPEAAPLINRAALGNAWFVNQVKMVPSADSELSALSHFNPKQTAIVDQRFSGDLQGLQLIADPAASIKLDSYKANELAYSTSTTTDQVAVFSEIYYKDGWNAYLDNKIVPHFRANYVLRAMRIPAGKHTIVFKFEPKVYALGENLSLASSSLLLILLIGIAFIEVRKTRALTK